MSMLSDLQNKKLGLFELIAMGFDLYLNNFRIFVSLLCATILPFLIIINIIQPYISFNPILLILYFPIFLFYLIFVLVFYTSASAILTESFIIAEKPQLQVVFKRIWHRILPLTSLNIRFTIIFYLKLLLLIVPGIIYSVDNGFYALAFILRDQRGKAAFQYSESLVTGNWWRVFSFNLLSLIPIYGLQVILNKVLSSVIVNSPTLIAIVSNTLGLLINLGFVISGVLLFLNLDYQKR
ncbi:hypothetical protein NIES4071_25570 [Calothrix sp. NIES-4071]|nr:hypothetical protein NIES4071_25570 [Calothrix sp. NIES-4071]BAZ56880.1 hypothetical protein NIES4105_25510 [Calothrix sp. NIES-4105]